jgi:hypothetical protein
MRSAMHQPGRIREGAPKIWLMSKRVRGLNSKTERLCESRKIKLRVCSLRQDAAETCHLLNRTIGRANYQTKNRNSGVSR